MVRTVYRVTFEVEDNFGQTPNARFVADEVSKLLKAAKASYMGPTPFDQLKSLKEFDYGPVVARVIV